MQIQPHIKTTKNPPITEPATQLPSDYQPRLSSRAEKNVRGNAAVLELKENYDRRS
jgi:hypothetical protein